MTTESSMLIRLPQYVAMIQRNIDSSINEIHLQICREFIELFYNRYLFLLPVHDLQLHLYSLNCRISKKEIELLAQTGSKLKKNDTDTVMKAVVNTYEDLNHQLNALFTDLQPVPSAQNINPRINQVFLQLKKLRNLVFVQSYNQVN